MEIRKAPVDDIEGITEMCVSSMAATYGHIMTEEEMRPWIEGDETLKHVTKTIEFSSVAVNKGAICGVVTLDKDLIDLVWVGIEYRGKGIAKLLMDEAEKQLKENGYKVAKLECFEGNDAAIGFYESVGWIIQKVVKDETSGHNKFIMTKSLG